MGKIPHSRISSHAILQSQSQDSQLLNCETQKTIFEPIDKERNGCCFANCRSLGPNRKTAGRRGGLYTSVENLRRSAVPDTVSCWAARALSVVSTAKDCLGTNCRMSPVFFLDKSAVRSRDLANRSPPSRSKYLTLTLDCRLRLRDRHQITPRLQIDFIAPFLRLWNSQTISAQVQISSRYWDSWLA